MQIDLIPEGLQVSYQTFLLQLEKLSVSVAVPCPYCASNAFSQIRQEPLTLRCKVCLKYYNQLTGTPFNRLTPTHCFLKIFVARINRETYQAIADKLDCSVKKVALRDKAIMRAMQQHFANLHQWYRVYNAVQQTIPVTLPNTVVAQHVAFKQQITGLLTATTANCLYCHSNNTVKISKRTAFRCKACLRGFNLLDNTSIRRLRDVNKWLSFIDALIAKQHNVAISANLSMNSSTASYWRRVWCATMQQWGFDALAIWCKR